MSESPASSRNTPPSRTHSDCVTPQRTSGFNSSLLDDQLLGAWDALPDADTPLLKAPQDDEKLIVPRMPALSRHQDNGPVQSIRPTPAPNRQAAPLWQLLQKITRNLRPLNPPPAHSPPNQFPRPHPPVVPRRPSSPPSLAALHHSITTWSTSRSGPPEQWPLQLWLWPAIGASPQSWEAPALPWKQSP